MQKYNLSVSVESSSLRFKLTGREVNYSHVSQSAYTSARNIANLYYGTEFSEETLIIAQAIEERYLSSNEIKHHDSAWPIWIRAVGQYVYDNLLPAEISRTLNRLPDGSVIRLELDESVSRVPWELMYNGESFTCLKYILGRVPPDAATPSPIRGNIPMLIVADPLGDLYGARNEANYIISQLRGSNLRIARYGNEIRKRDYLRLLKSGEYRIVHYSGHSASSREPGQACHLFKDGRCYGWEIEELGMSKPPLLVFSNSCQSAEDSLEKDETGNTSLAGSYLKAGTGGCIAAIWLVSDRGSSNFASDFYRYILFGATLGEAVLRARQSAFKRWGYQDFIWGSYILFGDPDLRLVNRV